MHKCWLIPELVSRIVHECTWTTIILSATDKEGLRTLYSLARTCHALLGPALDMLWYRQDTLAHVIKCLPDELWVVTEDAGWQPRKEVRLTHRRPFTLDDWTRFDFYAKRIRVFATNTWDSEGPPHRSRDVLDTLCGLRDTPLLPRLRSINIQVQLELSCDIVQFSTLIAPRTLTDINLDLRELKVIALPALATSCSEVQRATLTINPRGADFSVLAETVPMWRKLRRLALQITSSKIVHSHAITVMDYRLLHELNTLPVLDELELAMWASIDNAQFEGGEAIPGRPFLFRTLRRLRLSSNHTRHISQILKDISPPSLRDLEIQGTDTSVFTIPEPFIQSQSFVRDLQKLKITYLQPPGGQRGTVVLSSTLRAFACMHRLRELSLGINNFFMITCAIETTDTDWESCVPSWPHLQCLEIFDADRPAKRPTVRTLMILAQHCPKLEMVEMTVQQEESATGVPNQGSIEQVTVHHSGESPHAVVEELLVHARLTHLRLRHTSLVDGGLDEMARDVAKTFPQLRNVTRLIKVRGFSLPGPAGSRHNQDIPRFKEVPWEEFIQRIGHRR